MDLDMIIYKWTDYICEWSYLKINYPNFDHNVCD